MTFDNKKVLSADNAELNRQDIFNQIDEDLLSQQKYFNIEQKTRSNYNFILVIDIIAFVFAVLGCVYLYDVFKEQQVRLVSGQNGVKVLEYTLVDVISKQYQKELKYKELELEMLSLQLDEITGKYEEALAKIEEESSKRIEQQKQELQLELIEALKGKNLEEQVRIRKEYELKIQQIIDQINLIKVQQTEQEREKFKKEYQKQEKLQAEIEKIEGKVVDFQSIITNQFATHFTSPNTISDELLEYQKLDSYIANRFKNIKPFLFSNKFQQVSNILIEIDSFYKTNNNKYLSDRKISDLDAIDSITNYMRIYNELDTLRSTNTFVTTNIQAFIKEYNQKKYNQKNLISYVDNVKKVNPELLKFSQNYAIFLNLYNSKSVNYNRINKLVQEKNYIEAIQEYKQILLNNNLARSVKEDVISRLAKTIELNVSNNIQTYNISNSVQINNIPRTLASKVQKILTDDRQNIQDAKIVYMAAPDGYILENLNDDQVLLTLMPGKRLGNRQLLDVYRITSDNVFTMDKIGQLKVINGKNKIARKYLLDKELRVGDLIFINK